MDSLKRNHVVSNKVIEDEPDRCYNHDGIVLTTKSTSKPPTMPLNSIKSTKHIVSNGQVGGVDEETFLSSFDKVPPVKIYSGKEVDEYLRKYNEILKNDNEDWNKRVDCLKRIRSLIVAGALNYNEFYDYLNMLLPSFHSCIKDLRSMVVRETCVTIAYLSQMLELKFDHFAESALNALINLIQSSKKVMASSAVVCIKFILQYTHAPRLIPILVASLNSKSKVIRRTCCEFINFVLQTWHSHSMEKHATLLQNAIKKGIVDADAEARQFSRQAYTAFAQKFPDLGESLKNSFDSTHKKLSFSGSNSSLSRAIEPKIGARPTNIATSVRSTSAIDLQAVRRAKTRAQYAAMARHKFSGATTIEAPVKTQEYREGRTKNRVSVSQPTSRSGSPSSKYSTYSHYLASNRNVSRSRKSSIGNESSRETSPTRSPYNFKSRLPYSQSSRRPLLPGRETEIDSFDGSGDASMSSPYMFRNTLRNAHRPLDDHSDESETSSMCSESSFDSYRRQSDSASWNGSQHRLYRDTSDCLLRDIADIIANCESPHWNERKKGLMSLQLYLQEGNKLELTELKRIADTFLKIFNDPHVKVFSLFLDTLNELIVNYSTDLCFCLHLLLTRLFNKLGADLLNSTHSKLMKTLDNVFAVFPPDLQLQSVFRFLVDPTQTPNNRVKLAALGYLVRLATIADSSATFTSTTKDYPSMALTKLVSWTTGDLKSSSEVRKASQDAIIALFNLNPSQVTCRLSTMPREYQETAAAICKSATFNSTSVDVVSTIKNSSDNGYETFCEPLLTNHCKNVSTCKTSKVNNNVVSLNSNASPSPKEFNSTIDFNAALKTYLDELAQIKNDDSRAKREVLLKLKTAVRECQSDVLISHFKAILGKVVSCMSSTESPLVKEAGVVLLQAVILRKTVAFVLKDFSDLVITKTIALCGDTAADVVKQAENCALSLATHLPAESVVRIVVPLITSETGQMKLVAIKMLTRLVETSDEPIVVECIDQIMPILLVAYDDVQSSIRKAAVFCIVSLYRQSDTTKRRMEAYISKLQGAKLKLLQLYIQRAEQGCSIPTSPRTT